MSVVGFAGGIDFFWVNLMIWFDGKLVLGWLMIEIVCLNEVKG